MFEQIKNAWINLTAIGFFPLIAVFGVAAYFTMRSMTTKGRSVGAVAVVNLLGQLYYAFPRKAEDISGTLFFAIMQSVVAFGIYSFLEWLWNTGLVQDKIDKWFKSGGSNANTPAV